MINGQVGVDIARLVNLMLYYQEVHLIASYFEFQQLIGSFGDDILLELLRNRRLIVHVCDQHIGIGVHGNNIYSTGLYSTNCQNVNNALYNFHRKFVKNSTKNMQFADKFSPYCTLYKYSDNIDGVLKADLVDSKFLTDATAAYISKYYPSYDIRDIRVEANPITDLNGFYKIESNLNIDTINLIHEEEGISWKFDFSGILIAIGETYCDTATSASFDSELAVDSRYAEICKLRMNSAINSAIKSQGQIDNFQETFAFKYLSIGDAFIAGYITPRELLEILLSEQAVRFRKWTLTLKENSPLPAEYYEEINRLKTDKSYWKVIRAITTTILGLIPGIGVATGVSASIGDQFFVDRLINGWKPKLFVDKVLRNNKIKIKNDYS